MVSFELLPAAERGPERQAALARLSAAVYPPELVADWPGRALEWARPTWSVMARGEAGEALAHVGLLLRAGSLAGRAVCLGGVGGIMTHPQARGRGLASQGIERAIAFCRAQAADFMLLVCEPALVPWYEGLGWTRHTGPLLVEQAGVEVPFDFNLPMTYPLALRPAGDEQIQLLGPPW